MVLEHLTTAGRFGLTMFLFGAALVVFAFVSPHWVSIRVIEYAGLWQFCTSESCISTLGSGFKEFGASLPMWYRGTQALVCLAFILVLITMVLRFMYVCRKMKKSLNLLSFILDFMTALLCFMAATVFGVSVIREFWKLMFPSWGVGAIVLAGLLFLFSGVSFILEHMFGGEKPPPPIES